MQLEHVDDPLINPALAAWRKFDAGVDPYRGEEKDQDRRFQWFMLQQRARLITMKRWAHAVPDRDAVAALVALSPIVEMGAGSGYWAGILARAGADVIAYDDRSWARYRGRYGRFHPVLKGGARRTARHPHRTLFLCWPPYDTPMAYRAVRSWAGRTLAYIGESWGGCTGCDRFHRYVDEHFREVQHIAIPQWWGVHDWLTIYERKGTP